MNSISMEKIEAVKKLLKRIHQGEDYAKLKEKFEHVLSEISPFEIVLIEQELVREGVSFNEIMKMCDIHLELFKKSLMSRELKGVPEGHPLDLLLRENDDILKTIDTLGIYTSNLKIAFENRKENEVNMLLNNIKELLSILRKSLRSHYRKNQMILFPYLERRGISAIPRVLWGREDQVLVKIRDTSNLLEKALSSHEDAVISEIIGNLMRIVQDTVDLVFRETKILYPTLWTLLTEDEWAAVDEVAWKLGYNVKIEKREWTPSAEPIYPYEIDPTVPSERIDKLPEEIKGILLSGKTSPDEYAISRPGDIELETGFLSKEEIEAIFRSLPLELTYANTDRRVRFFSESRIASGFPRAKTIIGRRLEYCHPPRLENYVLRNIEYLLKSGEEKRVFWTRLGDRIMRVLLVAVRNSDGKVLGVLEIVEDFTDIVNNPDEVKKKIMVL